jgi:hypothetical protein
MQRTAPGVINDDIDARLKELDELCRPLLMLDTPDVTWTLESFVAWAQPLIARPDAVSALTTETHRYVDPYRSLTVTSGPPGPASCGHRPARLPQPQSTADQ